MRPSPTTLSWRWATALGVLPLLVWAFGCPDPQGNLGAPESPPLLPVRAGHLGERCRVPWAPEGPWRLGYEALATPGGTVLDPVLVALQYSVIPAVQANPHDVMARHPLASVLEARTEANGGQAKLEGAGAMEAEAAREIRHTFELAGLREEFRRLERMALALGGEGLPPQRPEGGG
ncbi:MAG: hypothetical protein RQ751_13100 [Longimicrobiales bacterium]|nr:hypothetical protein [Longimicrobiales bacterium]